ncbi:heterodisulfide reductase-related iron-sulfur binding cluster [Tunturiibacter gelidoferens]|uniref:Fe-S oxidoreductase n=1 Tax=Tunturiibacter lichenicola TaxID=2051959 RepID=A0A7Y9T1K4_9BACT|nr:heterodisulfide reductase-related iron-sulfur binding cluster [Edaphobacter lichenicola]NYF50608.1 Fe-S oxidoreductase [Edaphobacter lichenicola]
MLPFPQKIAFLLFAVVTLALGFHGFYRLYLRIRRGTPDPEPRFNKLPRRLLYALTTTLTQQRTFKKRPTIGLFHSFIFYGFIFYGLVNLVDAAEGYLPFLTINGLSSNRIGALYAIIIVVAAYSFLADLLSFLVLLGVVALVIRRFALPSRTDFRFNPRTLLHKDVQQSKITRDSLIVSAFILFHVGSRAIGAGAKIAAEGPDPLQPFATLLSHLFTPANAEAFRIFGYWGALGSVLAFLAYFPYTKHIHIFMAPAKYLVAREPSSGVLPLAALNLDTEDESEPDTKAEPNPKTIGAAKLEDLAWPRLLDAYACIQCNRCQDVCPATATGKSLSPAALEINKRMELNDLAAERSPFSFTPAPFEKNAPTPRPLLQFALSPEAAWACTTCGACMEVCPTQNEQMLDIIDIRRNQVMIEGEFPSQLQSAFRGMERAQNPWGINHEQRLAWADGLNVKTTDENPNPDVLYWVGCAASYDPQAQKTARAFVELLNHAEVNFALLGKKECCTGDSARRAGNEYLYRQLADKNVSTLNTVQPKLIVASCPHCMNSIGHEYKQIGGDYKVMHHTEYLETLVATKKLTATPSDATITYHDPCYLGRHNGVYEAPRNLLNILSNSTPELPRNRENSFCCGAGGAQFWKEEEEGNERISDNRFREAQQTLAPATGEKVLAVGCPFCKSMLGSTPNKADSEDIAIKDVAELLLEGVRRSKGLTTAVTPPRSEATPQPTLEPAIITPIAAQPPSVEPHTPEAPPVATPSPERKKWQPKSAAPTQPAENPPIAAPVTEQAPSTAAVQTQTTLERKKWQPKTTTTPLPEPASDQTPTPAIAPIQQSTAAAPASESASIQDVQPPSPERKKWQPKSAALTAVPESEPTPTPESETPATPADAAAPARKKWIPKKPT